MCFRAARYRENKALGRRLTKHWCKRDRAHRPHTRTTRPFRRPKEAGTSTDALERVNTLKSAKCLPRLFLPMAHMRCTHKGRAKGSHSHGRMPRSSSSSQPLIEGGKSRDRGAAAVRAGGPEVRFGSARRRPPAASGTPPPLGTHFPSRGRPLLSDGFARPPLLISVSYDNG